MHSRISWIACAAILPAVFALTGCDRPIDTEQLQDEIATQVKQQVGVKVKVKCPSDVEAKKGKAFDCTVVQANGTVSTAKVTLTNDKGGFSYDIVAGAPAGSPTSPATTTPPAATTPVTPPAATTPVTPPAATTTP